MPNAADMHDDYEAFIINTYQSLVASALRRELNPEELEILRQVGRFDPVLPDLSAYMR